MSLLSTMFNFYCIVAFLLLLDVSQASYDYIIVGGGTGGLLLARLLSDNSNTTVAVLEAGLDARTDPRITVPENAGGIVGTEYDWNLTSVAQPYLYQNATVAYARGRTLGGSSAMNFMIHHRASAPELDAWESVLNVSGWDWDALFAASKAAEDFTAPPAALEAQGLTFDPAYHGSSGPIADSMARDTYSLFTDYVIPSLQELGVTKLVDANGGNTTGVRYDPFAINASSYTRSYSGSAYTNVEGRSNLAVLTNTTVTRIVWADNQSPEGLVIASGVEYIDPSTGNLAVLNASNVILSAGTLMSPPLLEVSGIGDSSLLSTLGIPVVVDLPAVGTQLQDHLVYQGSFSFNVTLDLTGGQYLGFLIEHVPPSRFLSAEDYAFATDLLFNISSDSVLVQGTSDTSLAMARALWTADEPFLEFNWFYGWMSGYVLHPLSSGSVHTAAAAATAATTTTGPLSASPQPEINPGFNSAQINGTSFDLWLLAKGLQYYARTVASVGPLGAAGAQYSVAGAQSFEAFQDGIFTGLSGGAHPTGGCVLLPRAQSGVVDEQLRVYGTQNVRVVDASVVPASPGQHTMSLVYAIAARAAELLQAG